MCSFRGSKKRDLSDKSQNGEDSKKHRKNSDSVSSLPDYVFSDGFDSPKCGKILIDHLKKYRIAAKRTFCAPQRYQKILKLKAKQLESLADVLKLLSAKFDELDELEKDREKKDKKIYELEKKNESLESKFGDSADELEQYSRRNFLLLHCVQERP